MKKLFTLIALAAIAMGVNAQKITFTEADEAAAGTLDGKVFASGDFKLTITDTSGKVALDKNAQLFGTAEANEKSGGGRLKSGGKSSSSNMLTLTIPSAGTLKILARTGSNSATDRTVVVTQNETELYNQVVKEDDAVKVTGLDESDPSKETNVYPIISVPVEAGEVVVTYPIGSINFYGFELVSGSSVETQTWTLVGAGTLCGSTWDLNDESNLLTTTDGVNYTLVKEDVVLEKGTSYDYKAAKDKAWDTSVPQQGNQTLTVDETGKYKVTFTLNVETGVLTAEAVKTGEAEVGEKTYSVIGNFKGDTNWTIDYDMVKGADGLYTTVIDGVDAGNYEFKVRVNHDWSEAYPSSNYQITVDANGSAVTVTFNADTKEVTAVADATKIAAVKAEKAGVKYNLAGRKVNAQYKGIVIENGRKVLK